MKSKLLTLPKINLILLCILALTVCLALFIPIDPLTVKSIRPVGNEFTAGQEFKYQIDRCRNVDESIAGSAYRYLIDVNDPTLNPIDLGSNLNSTAPRGCGIITVTIILPDHVPTGEYKLKLVTKYNPGWFRGEITNTYFSDENFKIRAK